MARKYLNDVVEVDGVSFASKREAARYEDLKMLRRAGLITDLQTQPRFVITINGQRICAYVGDFAYRCTKDGAQVVEDVKSKFTAKMPVYRLKRKLMKAVHGIDIVEVV